MQISTKIMPLAGAIAFAFAGTAAAQEVVKIGHVGPISGAIAHLGKDNENGARMAIDELNAKGVMIGGKKVKLELLTEDDAADPKQATAVAQKLVDAKVQGVIGHLNSGTTIPASKIYNEAGIPQISPSATNPKYTQQGFKTAFRLVANDGQLGGTLGRYAVQINKAKKVAVIDDRTAYGQGVSEEFIKGVNSKKAGTEVVGRQYTTDKATDFGAILTAIKAKNPDVIFFGGMDAVAGPMLRQMKQLGINAKLMGGDGICTEALATLAGDAMADNQVVCAEAGGVEDAQKSTLDDFKAAYKKKFGVDVQIYAPYVYDSVMTMVEAMQKAGSSDPAKYLPFLAKTKRKGVTGNIAFDAKGDMLEGTLTLYTYKGGKRSLLAVTK
ncbi:MULTISPECIES: branched-chain amino acid ABC transporter substrate-binding protein [unclassified Janthinobacterium]|uniref:branched-chain amino acid ABC transporter substrate-binding protein n=1 Tax=unclassified Janthinobacterium TaxID=2610881 RepID=UPI00034AE5A1|nr:MULTISPECIES: branched-chain amino acid ABC transporter substrate-binding protein [unclassified Janthinobacterium]MEC5163002.1 branched-chain amino acid transport system substrate-binding protein [Janthinobacterium sp. CG_S6]